ncbi:MAG: arginase family protein, partial [Candidatus Electryoneaceae bacterium]|nr:arginase family protein [Candidatus Electryoneaceae bacterium]
MDPANGVVMASYLGSSESCSTGQAAIIGVPYDGTSSHRAGSNLGPGALRNGSRSLETYSPFLHRDLNDIEFVDRGDLDVSSGDPVKTVEIAASQVKNALSNGMHPVLLGGEHTVTLGAVQALVDVYPDLHLLQLDAH